MVIAIHKPAGITSHDVIRRVRRITGIKKVGHAGTLDPFATGVLIVLIGKESTVKSQEFMMGGKIYLATLKLGYVSDTYDVDGKISWVSDKIPSREEIQKVVIQFIGDIEQTPPIFSAKKVAGKKLYEYARKGQDVEIRSSKVTIDDVQLVRYEYPYVEILVACQKGVYIRSLGYDIGHKLRTGAYVETLVRTRVGSYTLSNALSLEEFNDFWTQYQK